MITTQPDRDATVPPNEMSGTAQDGSPAFHALGPEECVAVLSRHNSGRIAYALHDRVGIEPIHYAYENGWVYGKTFRGSRLEALGHHPWVAFQVDEVDEMLVWSSVEVHGTFYRAEADGPVSERDARKHAMALLAELAPGSMTSSDPVGVRDVVFRIHLNEVIGRQSRSRSTARAASP